MVEMQRLSELIPVSEPGRARGHGRDRLPKRWASRQSVGRIRQQM